MPHDPVRIMETTAWLRRAASDLRAAAHELGADPPILDDLVFHCQQAVEKSMKAFLRRPSRLRSSTTFSNGREGCLVLFSNAPRSAASPLSECRIAHHGPGFRQNRLRHAASPTNPEPRSSSEAGSGTG